MKRLLCIMLCASMLLLTACSDRVVTDSVAAVTLPPAEEGDIPHGTDGLSYEAVVPLFLPSADGRSLTAVYTTLTLDRGTFHAKAVAEALLAYPGDDKVTAIGGGITLSLYGRNPVEVSNGICTVNLSSSALNLEKSAFYTACLSLAATLTQQDDISYVNVLVCDQPVALDIAGYLPTGSLTAHPGEAPGDLWEIMDARRIPLGQNASDVSLSSAVTLYFPMADKSGIMPEVRTLTFSGQTPAQLASGLLSALSAGAQTLDGVCKMPDLTSLLTKQPTVSEQTDGSHMITLSFTPDLENRLILLGIEPMCFTASIVCTLTTFIPGVSSVCIVSGSTMMTSLYSRTLGSLTFREGVQRRTQYAGFLREQVSVWLALDGRLAPVTRTVAASEAHDTATMFSLLSDGPTEEEKAAGYSASIPQGFDGSDILGVAADGDTLSVNFSERFSFAIKAQTMDERLLCYSLVTTLCRAQSLKRARFYFASEMLESLGGSLYWGGSFMLNSSVLQSGS